MYKKLFIFIIIFLCFTISKTAFAEQITVSAKAAVVMEKSTGRILYKKNDSARLPMASTTKIMTAICVLENENPKKMIEVDDRSIGVEGSSIYLKYREKITVLDLLYGMMLSSGNDAATALAIEVSGSVEKFAALMNKTAARIGAKNTHFKNPSGLYDDDHYTTATDLAKICVYAMKNKTFAQIVSTEKKKISNADLPYKRILSNHNKLLRMYEGCIGVKTGYTKKCGRCLVSAACRDKLTLVCVTLSAPDDWNDHTRLLDYGFSRCMIKNVASAGDYAISAPVNGGTIESASLSFSGEISYPCFDKSKENPELLIQLNKKIKAPLREGQKVGEAKLIVRGKVISKTDLISLINVPLKMEKSFILRLIDKLKNIFSLYINY